jgi:hypothetical protein
LAVRIHSKTAPKDSKHLAEAKKLRDKQDTIKRTGDSLGRWKEFMERGPDRLPTDESEEYDPDSADEIIVPLEVDEEDLLEMITNKINVKLEFTHEEKGGGGECGISKMKQPSKSIGDI